MLEPTQAFGQCGRRQRRRQMADRDGADPPFGLRCLAGIVDDEGIDDRQIADQCFRPAAGRQRHGLAGQPFERSVCAHMDYGVNAFVPEPEIERDIGVARRAREIVVFGVAIGRIASFRLDRDDRLAAPERGEMKRAAAATGIVFRRAPGCSRDRPAAAAEAWPVPRGSRRRSRSIPPGRALHRALLPRRHRSRRRRGRTSMVSTEASASSPTACAI